MRLRQIEVFHAIYTTGSMTSAARLLNVSQPSVSKVLAHAEQQLGYALFDRTRGKLIATPEAKRLFGLASKVFENVERLRHVAKNLRAADAGRIRLAATPAFGVELLPTAVSTYLDEYPATVFEIETLHHDEVGNALLESRIDIGLVFDAIPVPGLVAETLATSEFYVIAPPDLDLGDAERVTVAALDGMPFISLSNRGPLGQLLANYLDHCEADLKEQVFTETYHVAKELVARGVGIAIVDSVTAHSSVADNVNRWLLDPSLHYTVDVLSADAMPPSIVCRRFMEHLKSVAHAFGL